MKTAAVAPGRRLLARVFRLGSPLGAACPPPRFCPAGWVPPDGAPLGSRAGVPSAQRWGPGSGRLAGKRVCSHLTCFAGRGAGITGRTHLSSIQANWKDVVISGAPSQVSRKGLFATSWTTRLLCPWDFPKLEYWTGLPFPSPGVFPTQRWNPVSCIGRRFFTTEQPGKPISGCTCM